MENYLVYPTTVMNISQSYWDSYSHLNHNTASPADYPIDECCEDSGRSWFYCPCDNIEIVRIYGVGTSGTNTIWLTSSAPVKTPVGTFRVTIMVEHPNDDDLSRLNEGDVFRRGQPIFREGTDGWATGNHFHISVGAGTLGDSGGWVKNGNGAWVIDTTLGALKPEQAFYVNTNFTTNIIEDCGIDFYTITDDNINYPGNITPGAPVSENPSEPQIVVYKIINDITHSVYTNSIDRTKNLIELPSDYDQIDGKKCVGFKKDGDLTNDYYRLGAKINPPETWVNEIINFRYVYVDLPTSIYIFNLNNKKWQQILDIWIFNGEKEKWQQLLPYIFDENNNKWISLVEDNINVNYIEPDNSEDPIVVNESLPTEFEEINSNYENAAIIWNYLRRNLKYNVAVSAGIMGNIMAEVGGQTLEIDPYLDDTDGEYYGICQWSVYYYPEVKNKNLNEQLDFLANTIQSEFNTYSNNYYNGFSYSAFLNLTDPGDAAEAFAKVYERCASWTYQIRIDNAYEAYDYYVNK